MKMKDKFVVLYLLYSMLFFSCTRRNLAYFSDVKEGYYTTKMLNDIEPKIQPYDILSITVSSLNPEASALFNTGTLIQPGSITNFSTTNNAISNITREGYLVEKDGAINFPVLGKVQVSGLSKAQVTDKLITLLNEHLKGPIVSIRYLNYKVTVVGEVNRPSTFTIPAERINVLEALGMAGDMTAYGKRENVLIIREENGERKMKRLNLNSRDVFNSAYFYLQQNDIVYVEPDKKKEIQASTNTRTLSIITALVSIAAIIISKF